MVRIMKQHFGRSALDVVQRRNNGGTPGRERNIRPFYPVAVSSISVYQLRWDEVYLYLASVRFVVVDLPVADASIRSLTGGTKEVPGWVVVIHNLRHRLTLLLKMHFDQAAGLVVDEL